MARSYVILEGGGGSSIHYGLYYPQTSPVEGHLHNIGEFDDFLVYLAKSNPDLLMESVGEIILDKTLGWKFQFLEYKWLFKSLPEETVIDWIEEHGNRSCASTS